MPIVQPPIYNPASMSQPIEFITSAASANPILYALAALFTDGIQQTVVQKIPFQEIAGTYYFRFDFKRICEQTSAPIAQNLTSCFSDLNTNYVAYNPDLHSDIALQVTYFFEDPTTGKPTNLGIVDTVPFGTYEALTTQRQIGEALDLTEFNTGVRRCFTNQPNPYDITTSENLFLTFNGITVDRIQVTTYDSSGVMIDQGEIVVTIGTDQTPLTIGVGVPQLDGTTYATGAVNILNPNIAYYTVRGGFLAGSFVNLTELRTYNIVNDCSKRSLRVHFLNRLGGADAFTFTAAKVRKETSKSALGKKPLNWDYTASPPLNVYDKGSFKIDIKAGEFYEVESSFYGEAKGEWLAELLSSPETYIETSQGLKACTIDDTEITISDIDNLITVKATVRLAVDKFIQRY